MTISKLQRAQNNAARVVLDKSRRVDAKPLLRQLHWLPIQQRILSARWRCWREKHVLLAFQHTWTIISHCASPPDIHVQLLYHCSTYRVCPPTSPDARSAMPHHQRSGTVFPLKSLPAAQKQLLRNT